MKSKPSTDLLPNPTTDTPSIASHMPPLQKKESISSVRVVSTPLGSRAKEYIKVSLSPYKDPRSFKHGLLQYLNDEPKLTLVLMEERVADDIVLLRFHDTGYLIRGREDALEHPGTVKLWEETQYIQIEYKEQPFASDIEIKGDFFLPLGWLTESNLKGTKRATRYVCMLNISTKPMSLWLVFDYLINTNKGKTINIPDLTQIYDDDIFGYYEDPFDMRRAKKQIGSKDLLLVYKDVEDWDPCGETINDSSLFENLSFHLGPSIRAISIVPPQTLLDHVTAPESPLGLSALS